MHKAATLPIQLVKGHIAVPAEIDGHAVSVLVDTGSDRPMLTEQAAAELGLKRDPGHTTRLIGVGGETVSADAAVHRFEIGGIGLDDLSIPVGSLPDFPEATPPLAGIIGAEMLDDFDLDLDIPHHLLTLYTVHDCAGDFLPWHGRYASLPLERKPGGRMMASVSLDGHDLRALIDWGADFSVVKTPVAERIGVTPADLADDPEGDTRGVDRTVFTFHIHSFPSLQVGPTTISDVPLSVANVSLPGIDMLLGLDYARPRHLWLSYATDRLFIQPLTPAWSPAQTP